MIKSIRQLKKHLDARARADEPERDEEGRAVIEMTVLKDEDFLSDFSAGSRPVISTAIGEFLTENALAFHLQESFCIRINSDCIDDGERKIYAEALKEYYVRRYKRNRMDLKRNAFVSAVMAAVGVIALSAFVAMSLFDVNPVLSGVAEIFAWVFIWEAVDLFFLERQVLRCERIRYLHFIDAKVVFKPRSQR